LLVKIQPFIIR